MNVNLLIHSVQLEGRFRTERSAKEAKHTLRGLLKGLISLYESLDYLADDFMASIMKAIKKPQNKAVHRIADKSGSRALGAGINKQLIIPHLFWPG